MKKVLFYGMGNARDHANHYYSSNFENIDYCSVIQNNNALMEKYANVYVKKSLEEAILFAHDYCPDLIVISNKNDLKNGVYERFIQEGFKVFGINIAATKLETDKVYAKRLMEKYNISTPKYFYTKSKKDACAFFNKNWNNSKFGYVLKVSKDAKKSFDRTSVPDSLEEALVECDRLFETIDNVELLIEERVVGFEISLHLLIKDGKYTILPIVQDYKRKNLYDTGPMTAGIGCVASTEVKYDNILKILEKEVVKPTINMIKAEKIEYNYILYIGVIVDDDGKVLVLEYNTRSGNPEWLAILGLMKCSLLSVYNIYYTNFKKLNNIWIKNTNSIVIYGTTNDYPQCEKSRYSDSILGLNKLNKNIKLFGEHIIKRNEKYFPSGGRIFALCEIGQDFSKVKQSIITNFAKINMKNLYFRRDIISIEEKINQSTYKN